MALLLRVVHGYCSGIERLFELSESCRNVLVYQAKCMGLLRYEAPRHYNVEDSVEESWAEWVRQERSRRLGWAIYVRWPINAKVGRF